ncbi:MAG: serine--tRNA ligase [Alphaproteobacteria bacterium]|nr:serine--tRNA ligase [Alphaproteobacteria bacterium]
MFDLKLIRDTPDYFDSGWKRRGLEPQTPKIIEMDEKRRVLQTEMQELQSKRNDSSKKIGAIKSKGGDAAALMQEVAGYKNQIASLEEAEKECGKELTKLLSTLPNLPDETVPDGTSEEDNKEVRKVGQPKLMNNPKDHVDIGAGLGGMDFETAAKMSGSRFVLLRGGVARLERALAQFMLDTHTQEHGYTELSVPLLVNKEAMYGTGQLPKFENDLFKITQATKEEVLDFGYESSKKTVEDFLKKPHKDRVPPDDSWQEDIVESLKAFSVAKSLRYLIPTSEVPMTNTVLNSITPIGDLPLRLTALTPCFRSEAGSAGKDTRGMIRQHQFYKVELVSITEPEKSNEEHERMTGCAETILKKLDLAFRTVTLCTGDLGFSAHKTYDIEVWMPGQNLYREISSCSNCGDFQARRMMARYKKEGDKSTRYVHTLNGSGVAVGRCLIAVLENYQQPDGSVQIPDALKPYMGGITKLEPKGRSKNA